MKIVFITPASAIRRSFIYRIGGRFYGHSNAVTGPLILGHILKNAGHTVEVYEELYQKIDFSVCDSADVVCMYTMTSNAPRAYQIADRLRRKGKRVLLGGIHASAMPEEALEHADLVIRGEGELVIRDAVESSVSGKIIEAPTPENLDTIPFPDYSILKTPCETANVLTTRGCPFRCSFCTTSRMFSPYRERSIDSVIEELRYYKKLGFQYMNFEDDNFTANKDRTKEILRRMIAEQLVFRETFFFGRTDMANDEELLTLLEKAHLTRVLVGIESLNQKSLDTINKHQKIDDIKRCSGALQRHHIRLIASLVLGIDTDSKGDIRKGVSFCKKINAYQLQPAVLTPYPGTPVYQQYERENRIISRDWQFYDMMTVNFRPVKMSAWDLQKCFFRAILRFYTFTSSFKIMKLFGTEYGIRRMGLSLMVKCAVVGVFPFAKIRSKKPHAFKAI